MTPKEQITKIKECANLADASYAMLHYVEENEVFDMKDDKWKAEHSNAPARWIYADGIKMGYELPQDFKNIGRKQGQPTAYALAIEARFSQDRLIKLKEDAKPKEINNKIQNFIYRNPKKPELENQKIQVSTQKEKMAEEKTSYFLSRRTKDFVSRYELITHQKNTDNGFSATLFKDTKDNQLILACRGTELWSLEDLSADLDLAKDDIPLQCYDLAKFYEEKIKTHLGEDEKILVVGHSLGGYLAQSFCLMYPQRVQELYTFNSPGILDDQNQDSANESVEFFEPTYSTCSPLDDFTPNEMNLFLSIPRHEYGINTFVFQRTLRLLENYCSYIHPLKENIRVLNKNPNLLPRSLQDAKIFHIETTSTLNTQEHVNEWFPNNVIQRSGLDLKGDYIFLYVQERILDSHSISTTLKTLYFYEYLLENQSNHSLFLKDSLQESLNALSAFIKSVYQNMYDQIKQNEQKNSKNKSIIDRCQYHNSMSCYNHFSEMEAIIKSKVPHPIIAILDKALFEVTLITGESKQELASLGIIDAIEFLKENQCAIRVLSDRDIQAISPNSTMGELLSIYEFLSFVCVRNDNQVLLQTLQDYKKLTKRAMSTKIAVFSNPISDKMVEAYKAQTLFYSLEKAYQHLTESINKMNEERLCKEA